MDTSKEAIQCAVHQYCPCCGSDHLSLEPSTENGKVVVYGTCNYCNSKFQYNYVPTGLTVIEDNSEVIRMLKAKDRLITLLENVEATKLVGMDCDKNRTNFLVAELIGHLYNLNSSDLAEMYKTSTFKN